MKPLKLAGLIILILGAVLIYFGINATQAPIEEISETLTGRYSDTTMYYLIGGAVSIIVGLVILAKK